MRGCGGMWMCSGVGSWGEVHDWAGNCCQDVRVGGRGEKA